MKTQNYAGKELEYFGRVRHDILPLMPEFSGSVLEIGCGNGATLKYLKESGLSNQVHGMELTEAMALEAKPHLDQLWVGDAESLIFSVESQKYDVVLCLDVLEHLIDPWSFVTEISRILKPGGMVIASIPNLRTFTVIWNLLVLGRFDYASQGIMDQTHLRFFTKKTAIELLNTGELAVDRWEYSSFAPWSKSMILNLCTFGAFRHLLTEQYLVRAVKIS
jgi:2-polyprenyl-3-methyl-5-hydroxy-6-metoxy-1,4-benzoquinol methylase